MGITLAAGGMAEEMVISQEVSIMVSFLH